MDRQSDNHGSNTEMWHSCKPGVACVHGSWNGPKPGDSPAAEGKGGAFKFERTEEVMLALALAVEQRDRHTAGHCERLALMGVSMGRRWGWTMTACWCSIAAGICMTSAKSGFRTLFSLNQASYVRRVDHYADPHDSGRGDLRRHEVAEAGAAADPSSP